MIEYIITPRLRVSAIEPLSVLKVCLLRGAIPIILPEIPKVGGVDEVGLLFDRAPNFWGTVPQLKIFGQEKISGYVKEMGTDIDILTNEG